MTNEINDLEVTNLAPINPMIWDSFLKNLYRSQWPEKLPHPILVNLYQTSSLRPKKFFSMKNNNALTGISATNIEQKISRAVTFIGIDRQQFSKPDSIKLIQTNINYLKKMNIQTMNIQTEEFDTQIQKILIQLGFKKIRKYSNLIHDSKILQSVEIPDSIQLGSLQIGDEKKFTDILNKSFEKEWGFCPNTVEEIIHSIYSSNHNLNDIVILKKNNEFISFNWTQIFNKNIGKIGMIGVHPKFQNLGIGKITVLAGMNYLKSNKIKTITLEVDEANLRAIKLYTALEFKKYFSTIWFEKIL